MKLKLTIKEESEERVDGEYELPIYYINAIRRYAIARVPVYAIDKIIVYENTTAFFDEYIAHRIGQIPIKVDGEVDEEKVGFYLDFEGPGVIYSKDLKSNNDKVRVALDNIPILTLKEKQALRIEGRIKKGIGREHSKFQSGISGYSIDEEKGGIAKGSFFVESLYHMSAKEVLKRALRRLIEDLEELGKEIKRIEKK